MNSRSAVAFAGVLACGAPATEVDSLASTGTWADPSTETSPSDSSGAPTTSTDPTESGTTATSLGDSSGSTGDAPPGPVSCPAQRSETDLPDDSTDPQIRALYVVPADWPDEQLDTDGTICNSVLGWTRWLEQETAGHSLRLDTDDDVLDIGFVRLLLTDVQMHGTANVADVDSGFAYVRDRIERELATMGVLVPHKIYAVYYAGTSEYACGGGAYPPLIIDQVAAMYLGGDLVGFPPCGDAPWGQPREPLGYIDYAMLHEIVHTLGAVDLLAPHEHSTGHAFDLAARSPERDLMYSPRDGTDPPWGVYDPAGLALDLGGDDYFEHGDPDLVDLARSAFVEPMPVDATMPPGW